MFWFGIYNENKLILKIMKSRLVLILYQIKLKEFTIIKYFKAVFVPKRVQDSYLNYIQDSYI